MNWKNPANSIHYTLVLEKVFQQTVFTIPWCWKKKGTLLAVAASTSDSVDSSCLIILYLLLYYSCKNN